MDPRKQPTIDTQKKPPQTARPNEQGVVQVDSFVRITDPVTKQVIREMRG